MSAEQAKANAARAAVDFVRSGMVVGLGTGSTAAHFVRALAARKLDVLCAPTSLATEALALEVGLKLTPLDEIDHIDLTVDGADEIDDEFRLIKGGGGALLREKIIAAASERMAVIADDSKMVDVLGRFPLPVEITPFGAALTKRKIETALRHSGCASAASTLRMAGDGLFRTDGGNHILDCRCERIPDPEGLAARLSVIPGVVEHGLFIGLARTVVLGTPAGAEVRVR